MGDILVLGSLNMDLVSYVPYLPKNGETISSSKFLTIPGGKGANQAVAAGKLGADVRMIGKVGNDDYGRMLIDSLHDAGVKTDSVMEEGTTGMAFINVAESGENNIVLVPGANHSLTNVDIDRLSKYIAASEIIIMQLEIPLSIVDYVISVAQQYEKKIILNPAPATKLSNHMFESIHTIIPNEVELGMLTQQSIQTEEDVIVASRKLLSLGVKRVVTTLGSKGSIIVTDEHAINVPAIEVDAVDTTAAGDSYIGAFAVGMMKGMSDKEAALFASKTASIVVTREGAQTSMPTLKEVETLQQV